MNFHVTQVVTAKRPTARERLHVALDRLAQDQKAILHLLFWDEQEPEEIARLLGRSPEAVSRLIKNSLAALRASLEHDESPSTFANVA